MKLVAFFLITLFLIGCTSSTKEIRIYKTSFIDGCLLGMFALAQETGFEISPIKARTYCQTAHFEMIKRENPEYEMSKKSSGNRI